MKKFIVLALCMIPVATFAASSVRVLGNQSSSTTLAGQGSTKITPTKATASTATVKSSGTTTSRIGTLRAKSGNPTGAISGATTRFPVITPSYSYSSVTGEQEVANVVSTNVDVDTTSIINTVTNNVNNTISNQYYNKEQVYNNQEFVNAVQAIVDDPRIDAIRVGSRPSHNKALDRNYVYMWIEE